MSSLPSGGTLDIDRIDIFPGKREDPFDKDMAWRRHESGKRFIVPVKCDLLKSSAVATPPALILHSYQVPS